jgi:hypothetical protein
MHLDKILRKRRDKEKARAELEEVTVGGEWQ